MTSPSTCRSCGAQIVFIVTDEGVKVPINPSSPCYSSFKGTDGKEYWVRNRNAYVSHFVTCKDPERFSSGGGKRRPGGAGT